MKTLTQILVEGGHSLALRDSRGNVHTYAGRGVADLYRLLTREPDTLRGADIADKVVGKGAAALMALGGVARVHALTISRPALELLAAEGVAASFDTVTDSIINRSATGPCPVEALCLPCATAADCLPLISQFIKSLPHASHP